MAPSLPHSLAALGDAVWPADTLGSAAGATLASGHAALDAVLPGGGWPLDALSELLQPPGLHAEWRLLLPALVRLQQASPGALVLVGPPHVPFGPALQAQGLAVQRLLWLQVSEPQARLWATEQALRCAGVQAVLAWLPQVRAEPLRRLQLAAAAGRTLGLMLIRQGQGSNATETRWSCAPLPNPAVPADADSTLHQWSLIKNKSGTLGDWTVRWNGASAAFHLVSKAGERPGLAPPPL